MTVHAVGLVAGVVIEGDIEEVVAVDMAGVTLTGIVIIWWGMTGDTIVWADEAMIKIDILPVIDKMALGTIGPKATVMGFNGRMASKTGRIDISIEAIGMAGATTQISMPPHQWKKVVSNCVICPLREGNNLIVV